MSVIPSKRYYVLSFKDVKKADSFTVLRNGEESEEYDYSYAGGCFTLKINKVTVFEKIEIILDKYIPASNPELSERIVNVFSRLQAHTLVKDALYAPFKNVKSPQEAEKLINRSALSPDIKEALRECTAD